jgi:hypothetical protein
MTAKQRAQWFLGIHPNQIRDRIPAQFTNAIDALAACDLIIQDTSEQRPPLTANYWKEVKEELIKLSN